MTEKPETDFDQLARIRKLLETAESFASKPGEESAKAAESYRSKAFELAARYEIDHALLLDRPSATKQTVQNRIFDVNRPFTQQKTLAWIVYKNSGCQLLDIGHRRETRGRVHAFGFESDMTRADMLFTSLVLQASREAVRGYREYVEKFEPWSCEECGSETWQKVPMDEGWYRCRECYEEFYASKEPAKTPERRSVWYRSFWNGWVDGLRPRIELAHKQVTDQATQTVGTGAEIALRNRDVAVTEERDRLYPKIRTKRLRGSSGSGYNAGKQAGQRADIGTGKLGATKRELR